MGPSSKYGAAAAAASCDPRCLHQRLLFIIIILSPVTEAGSSTWAPGLLEVRCAVGQRAVLPCRWTSRLESAPPPPCHVEWQSADTSTVLERRGARRWEAPEFGGRAEVPEEELGAGDCSLLISDVQVTDAGRYESFMLLDGRRPAQRRRVFIQAVSLSVSDHRSNQDVKAGDDLVLYLHTSHSLRVIFQQANGSEWSDVWMRGDENTGRVWKDPERERLTLRDLRPSDRGTFKVLDRHGLAISTAHIHVLDHGSTGSAADAAAAEQEAGVPVGGAAVVSSSRTSLVLVLGWCLQLRTLLQ